ncbi:hypothetical protein DFS33DRAFT_1452780 [Desarmillaria ectypa]|nr:hypothetical protein DFS33DRAFT_1452780 [Desarmillaria ectypa]
MKIDLTEEQLVGHNNATMRGAAEGFVVGTGLGMAGSAALGRIHAGYRALPPSLKALGIILFAAPTFVIQAERRGIEFDKSQWRDSTAELLDEKERQKEERWQNLTFGGRLTDWAQRHEYSVFLGGWAASLGLAGAIIARDKLQTTSQKVVQARMWAQALAIALILGTAAFKAHQSRHSAPVMDHSWMDVLEQQERARKDEEAHLKQLASPEARRLASGL